MYYIVYKITNKLNNKIYIGSHKTKNLDDGYMGSGKYLKRAIENHGPENFLKEILFVFDSPHLMYAKEAELVNEEFLTTENTYNLKKGGFGGWDYINSQIETRIEKNRKARNSANSVIKEKYGVENFAQTESFRKFQSERLKKMHAEGMFSPPPSFLGRRHREDSKKKIGEKNSKHQTGSGNSQYGKMWITNGIESIKINKNDTIQDGWRKGRIISKNTKEM